MSDGGHGGGGGHGKRRGGHDEEHEEHENHERWLVSYADMMTLLMVLFIVMFAISQVDQKKFMALKTGLAAGFGAPVAMLAGADAMLDVGGAIAPDSVNLPGQAGKGKNTKPTTDPSVSSQSVKELVDAQNAGAVKEEVAKLVEARKALQEALQKAGAANQASFRFDERGLVVSIATDKVLFAEGGADILPAGRKILDALTPTLAKLPNDLSIDGHTNTRPINTSRFRSNWELSTARATDVLQYLLGKIPPDRLHATGFGDTKPLKPYTDPRAMEINRRVEIVVLAYLDNSLGQELAKLGNAESAGDSTGESTGSSSEATPTAEDDPWGATPTPTPSAPDDWAADPTAEPSAGGKAKPTAAPSVDEWGETVTPTAQPSDWAAE